MLMVQVVGGTSIAPGGAFFDDAPFFLGEVIIVAPLLDLASEARHFLLIGLRPCQDAIKNFFHLIFGHR